MEDNYNDLGGFLRKKLAETDVSSDWDRPDEDLRNRLQGQLLVGAQPKPYFLKLSLLAASLLFFALVGGYIFQLKNQNTLLEEGFASTQEELKQAQGQIILLEEKTTALSQKNVDLAKGSQVTATTAAAETTAMAKRMQQQKSSIAQLEKNNRRLQGELLAAERQIATLLQNTPSKEHQVAGGGAEVPLTRPSKDLDRLVFQQIFSHPIQPKQLSTRPLVLPQTIKPASFTTVKGQRKLFEIGYQYGLIGLEMPAHKSFEKQKIISARIKEKEKIAHSNGLFFAYSPKPNWWIRTGFRRAAFTLEQQYTTGLKYDKTREYIDQLGNRSNSLLLSNKTPYSEERLEIGIDIENGSQIEEGDALEIHIEDSQKLKYYQVPLGVEGFLGKRKLQWLLEGGIQWNWLSFGDYNARLDIEEREVEVTRTLRLTKGYSKQFWSAYAGLGLNFQVTDRWHARTSITYNYNFINNKSTDFSKSNNLGRSLKLGLNYRF